jgi:hypothetical protein
MIIKMWNNLDIYQVLSPFLIQYIYNVYLVLVTILLSNAAKNVL